jgi:hypothetical protein
MCQPDERPLFIGLSLSACIRDILEGKVNKDDVHSLVVGTRAKNLADFELVCELYSGLTWKEFPEATALAMEFWDAGMITQPRLQHDNAISWYVGRGHWAKIVQL